jgi:hypothetical protein
MALRSLARRWLALQAEIDDLDGHLTTRVTAVAPDLVALPGVGVDTAGQLLVTYRRQPPPAPLRSRALTPTSTLSSRHRTESRWRCD